MMKEECARRARTASSVRANLLFRLTKQGFHPWWRKSIRPHLAVAGYLEQATLGASSFEGIGILHSRSSTRALRPVRLVLI
jgi:hypothetical protein